LSLGEQDGYKISGCGIHVDKIYPFVVGRLWIIIRGLVLKQFISKEGGPYFYKNLRPLVQNMK
jgi:hypothetical protein